MLNLHQLESQWLQYKLKSLLPYFIIFISLCIIIIVLSSFNFKEKTKTVEPKKELSSINQKDVNTSIDAKNNRTPSTQTKPATIQDLKDTQITTSKNLIHTQKIEEDKLVIKPSLDFIRTMQDNSPHDYNSYIAPEVAPKSTKKIVQTIQTAKIEEIVLDTNVEEVKKQEIKIKRRDTQDDIQHVIKRFKESNNPALSLFIAKKYYELKNYNQSYNYALITNQINKDIEESWLLFAKSLYKLDQKEKAIEILDKYISSSHSRRAEMLLENIKSGKIK
jgi:tetratricopeptide (TPR) repeat protein